VQYIFWLGTNEELSKAELRTVLEREEVSYRLLSDCSRYWLADVMGEIDSGLINRLGGVDRISELLGSKDKEWLAADIFKALSPTERKVMVGISKIGLPDINLHKLVRELKKVGRDNSVKINYVLPQGKGGRLNAAQVIFNQLIEGSNAEITLLKDDSRYLLAKTVQVQDIQGYEKRDTSRPVRDAKIGMLPPKLAQIMLNLIPDYIGKKPVIYDPFCGMGTVLQEGWLMGYKMVGSDIKERMVEASEANLDWVEKNFEADKSLGPNVFNHDIGKDLPADMAAKFNAVVTEPFLGEPLSTPLLDSEATVRQRDLSKLYLSFFRNIRPVIKENGWVVAVLPAPLVVEAKSRGYLLFPTEFVDEVERLGYISKHLGKNSRGIIYARPDAMVAREITLWRKK